MTEHELLLDAYATIAEQHGKLTEFYLSHEPCNHGEMLMIDLNTALACLEELLGKE